MKQKTKLPKRHEPLRLVSPRFLRALSLMAAKRDVRPYLEHVHVQADAGTVRYFASDGHCAIVAWHERRDGRCKLTRDGKRRKLGPLPGFRLTVPADIAGTLKSDCDIAPFNDAAGAEPAPAASPYEWILGGRAFKCQPWSGPGTTGGPSHDLIPEKFEPPKGEPAKASPVIMARLQRAMSILSGKAKNNRNPQAMLIPGDDNQVQAVVPVSGTITGCHMTGGALGLVMPYKWEEPENYRSKTNQRAAEARAVLAAMQTTTNDAEQ